MGRWRIVFPAAPDEGIDTECSPYWTKLGAQNRMFYRVCRFRVRVAARESSARSLSLWVWR